MSELRHARLRDVLRLASTLGRVASVTMIVGMTRMAPGQEPAEGGGVIVDGTNENGIVFTWDVTNNLKKSVNYVEIPIYDINTFSTPDGWEIVSAPRLDEGRFILKTDHFPSMIRPGWTLQFECKRPLRDTSLDGRVEVVIGFEDGSRMMVPNVLGPVKRSTAQSYAVPVFLAAILGVVFLARKLQGSRAKPGG